MAQRTQGDIAIFRDHPDADTARNLIEIRIADCGSRRFEGRIAEAYAAPAGSERAANAEFIVKAWNSHDKLVAALRGEHQAIDWLMARLIQLDPSFTPSKSEIWKFIAAGKEALDAA